MRQKERQGKEGPLVVAECEAGVLNMAQCWHQGRERCQKSLCSKDLDADMSTSLLQGEELRMSAPYDARMA